MKTSLNWLSDYVQIPWNPARLADELTMAGLEVEGTETLGAMAESIVVAEVLTRSPHPEADRLSVCTVNDGSDEPVQVVCGAHNCDVGKRVPFARIGTAFADFTIKKSKLRGQLSFGMICSEQELGLASESDGIMHLPADAPIGVPLGEYLKRGDTVIDWEVTPNRPDWLSHYGIAREIAALTGNTLTRPAVTLAAPGDAIHALTSVTVEAPELCPRYTARMIRNVTIAPSPEWLQERLRAIGLRPINNVVDITNFILMELGQPLHAFDFDQLAGGRIVVRRAAAGEKMQTLNDVTHTLTTEHLLICDAERGVALAGVMGGANSEISATTTTVLLESAAFNASNVRATGRGLGISSDSSYRFERGVDVEAVDYAGARAAQLICELAGGELVPGVIDIRVPATEALAIHCRFARVRRVLGVDLSAEQVRGILTRLGCTVVAEDAASVTVTAPSWRLDLEREADLIEEVARLYGLNNIPSAPARAQVGGVRGDDAFYPWQLLRRQLLGLGLDECVNYTLIGGDDAQRNTSYEQADLVQLKYPLSKQYNTLRPSLATTMIGNVAHNVAHGNDNLALFEVGTAFCASKRHPEERRELAIAITGTRVGEIHAGADDGERDLYDLRGILDALLTARRATDWTVRPAAHDALRPGYTAELLIGDKVLGVFGQVAKPLVADIRLKHPLYLALLDADALLALKVPALAFAAINTNPGTSRDIAFTAPESLEHAQVLATIADCRQRILESVELFDIYRDDKAIGEGRKSMAYRLVYRAADKTLTDKEVAKADGRIRQQLAERLQVTIRDS